MAGKSLRKQAFGAALLVVLLGGMPFSGGVATRIGGGTAWGRDVPSAPRAVVEEYLRLVTARPVSVDVLRASAPVELPYARIRLIVSTALDGPTLQGVDADAFRDTGRISRVEMPLPAGAFRERIEKALQASAACFKEPGDEALRMVDIWCQSTGVAGAYQPLLVKVWDDPGADVAQASDVPIKILGRLCHDDVPFITECQIAFDYQPAVFGSGMNDLSVAPGTVEHMTRIVAGRRELVEKSGRKGEAAGAVPIPIPGGVRMELTGLGNLPSGVCAHDGIKRRQEGERAFLGLADDVSEGTSVFSFQSPFPIGAAVLRAAFETVEESSSIEVDASIGDAPWIRVFRIGDRPTGLLDRWVLPTSPAGGQRLRVRVRMQSSADDPAREGPRALWHRLDVPISHRLEDTDGVLRLVDLPGQSSYASSRRPPLQIELQPQSLTPADLVAMVRDHQGDVIDVYAPCELDDAACAAIAGHVGTIRFWAPSPWLESPPAGLERLVSGPGWIGFPRLQQIPAPLAKVVGGGRKSLSFPAVRTADAVVLGVLAGCSGELSLDGLERLSAEQAAALGRCVGPKLSLSAARDIRVAGLPSQAFLRAAVAAPGALVLSSLEKIDESTAAILAAGRKHVVIDGVTELAPRVAAALAVAKGGIGLDGVASLDCETAGDLLTYSGAFLSLRGLRRAECRIDELQAVERRGAPTSLATTLQSPTPATATDGDAEATRDGVRVWLRPPEITVLDALLQSPGTFRLKPSPDGANADGQLDVATVSRLVRGSKNLDLDGFATISPEVFKELCHAKLVISMAQLREIPDGCLPELCNYQGRMLFLDGIGALGEERIQSLMKLITDDRVSLIGAGIYNVRGLRSDATNTRPELQKILGADFEQFWDRSGSEEWSGNARGDAFRAKVLLLSRTKVRFERGGVEVDWDRSAFSDNSRNKLDRLAELAKKVAMARKVLLFGQPP